MRDSAPIQIKPLENGTAREGFKFTIYLSFCRDKRKQVFIDMIMKGS